MTCLEPWTPRKRSAAEDARLAAMWPLADEIAETVFVCIEREGRILKARIAQKVRLELIGARHLWEDQPGAAPAAGAAAAANKDAPGTGSAEGAVHALTVEQRWVVAEALRTHAEAELKRHRTHRGPVRLRPDYKRWADEATRLSVLVDGAARVDIWPCAWSTPRPG